jgi:hypothetical protein
MINKIAILARPRTGSTSLYRMLESQLYPEGFKCFYEPYNPRNYVDYYRQGFDFDYIDPLLKFDKILIKTLFGCSQHPVKSLGLAEKEFINWMDGFFEKVIVLDRRNKRLQAESLLVNIDSKTGWDIPKVYEVDKIDARRIEKETNTFRHFSEKMKLIVEEKSWPIFYYEDLYVDHNMEEIKRMFDYLEIEMDDKKIYDFIISDKRKVRIDPH